MTLLMGAVLVLISVIHVLNGRSVDLRTDI